MGTVYSVDEMAALADVAHANGMVLHVDGARIANALVAAGHDLRTMLRDTGVDVVTFGLTKNGAMYGEAVVYLDPDLAATGQVRPKAGGAAALQDQVRRRPDPALLADDLWLRNARHANARPAGLAERVAAIDGVAWSRAPGGQRGVRHVPAGESPHSRSGRSSGPGTPSSRWSAG